MLLPAEEVFLLRLEALGVEIHLARAAALVTAAAGAAAVEAVVAALARRHARLGGGARRHRRRRRREVAGPEVLGRGRLLGPRPSLRFHKDLQEHQAFNSNLNE